MSFHRLLEDRAVEGRQRAAGSLVEHRGPPVPWLEPLDVPEHDAWLRAMARPLPMRVAA